MIFSAAMAGLPLPRVNILIPGRWIATAFLLSGKSKKSIFSRMSFETRLMMWHDESTIRNGGVYLQQTINVTIRLDGGVKGNAKKLFEDLGMDLSTALNIFARQALRQGKIPSGIFDPFHGEKNQAGLNRRIKEIEAGKNLAAHGLTADWDENNPQNTPRPFRAWARRWTRPVAPRDRG
jgi:DNA-damage-inducible protein J